MIKPPACSACPLGSRAPYERFTPKREWMGEHLARPDGEATSPVAFVGEALGGDEAAAAARDAELQQFVGRAGGVLNKGLLRLGHDRASQRVVNTVSCWPPNDWLVGAPWERQAIDHCAPNLDAVLWEPAHRVFVTLGVTATREVLRRWSIEYRGKMENWHGYPIGPAEGPWVVPTFHPSFILHDKWGHTYVLYRDIQLAYSVAEQGWQPDEPRLTVDPPLDWFEQWAAAWNPESWLSVDVETREKLAGQDEDEIKEDQPLDIVRINFSYHPDEGITVPWEPRFLPAISRLLGKSNGVYTLWNDRFDQRCLNHAGVPIRGLVLDGMAAWHCLQSDIRKSLGFVAPYFSKAGPWKHLSDVTPGEYAAKDAAQTTRIMHGLVPLLQESGQYEYAFRRHVVELDRRVLRPAERRGVRLDRKFLDEFAEDLRVKLEAITWEARGLVPEAALVLSGDRQRPDPVGHPGELAMEVERTVQVCLTCEEFPVSIKHVCKDPVTRKKLPDRQPYVVTAERRVTRYFDREPFELGSPTHLLRYIEVAGIALPQTRASKKKKTDRPTLDDAVMEILAKKHRVFKLVQDYRAVGKVKNTYVEGATGRVADGARKAMPSLLYKEGDYEVLRGYEFNHNASTQRLTCSVFPLQGVVADKDGNETIAAGFRKAVVPRPGHRLVEIDYRGIEAQITGWVCKDPNYIKWAKRDIHSYVTAHKIGKPPSLDWSEEHIRGYLAEIKKEYEKLRDDVKHVIHGVSYGRTVYGIQKGHPEAFPTLKSAEAIYEFYLSLCPNLKDFQAEVRNFAARNNYLGGVVGSEIPHEHPFGYIHWFWAVMDWDARRQEMRPDGPDSNRVVSLFPQSIAFGILAEADLELTDPEMPTYIGDAVGDPAVTTPFLALIHDSNLLEFREENWEAMTERAVVAMERPVEQLPCPEEWGLGECLSIEVEVKHSATTWKEMQKWKKAAKAA